MFEQRSKAEKEEIQRRYCSFIAYLESKERVAAISKNIKLQWKSAGRDDNP